MLTQTQAALILNGLPGIGPVAARRLSNAFNGNFIAVFEARKTTLASIHGIGNTLAEKIVDWNHLFDLEKEERALVAHKATFIPFFEPPFPPLLKEIPDPPLGLYVQGNIDALSTRKTIALVGTRKASLYGTTNAEKIASDLAMSGWTIISGGARGIDTAAHEGALNVHGNTIVVLGCGLDIIYPPENFELFKKVADCGGAVISEFPFGKKADKRTFPQRNRIVAGMAAGTFVVESDIAGGSIITANFATDCGRTVFALPGRVEQPGSRGCHKLMREGATLVTCAEDILEDLTGTPIQQSFHLEETNDPSLEENAENLSVDAQKVLTILRDGTARSPDELSEQTGFPFPLVSANLLLLELERLIVRKADGTYEIAK